MTPVKHTGNKKAKICLARRECIPKEKGVRKKKEKPKKLGAGKNNTGNLKKWGTHQHGMGTLYNWNRGTSVKFGEKKKTKIPSEQSWVPTQAKEKTGRVFRKEKNGGRWVMGQQPKKRGRTMHRNFWGQGKQFKLQGKKGRVKPKRAK